MTISIKLPGEDWYGETHRPVHVEGGGILWIPDTLDGPAYTHHVSQEDEDARDIFMEELLKAMMTPIDQGDTNDDPE